MIYPLVHEMAAPGARIRVPVAVACRVLGFSKQAYYQWLKQPVSAREIEEEHLISVLRELHADDPEGGYRVLADDLHDLGYVHLSERRVWRLCKIAGIQSVIVKRKRKYQKAGAPVGDDLVNRDFTADGLDEKWLTDITEHWTGQIPAVVATLGVWSGNGGAEVQLRAETGSARCYRSRVNSSCCRNSCRGVTPYRLSVGETGRVINLSQLAEAIL